jgi:hypothetical protein
MVSGDVCEVGQHSNGSLARQSWGQTVPQRIRPRNRLIGRAVVRERGSAPGAQNSRRASSGLQCLPPGPERRDASRPHASVTSSAVNPRTDRDRSRQISGARPPRGVRHAPVWSGSQGTAAPEQPRHLLGRRGGQSSQGEPAQVVASGSSALADDPDEIVVSVEGGGQGHAPGRFCRTSRALRVRITYGWFDPRAPQVLSRRPRFGSTSRAVRASPHARASPGRRAG